MWPLGRHKFSVAAHFTPRTEISKTLIFQTSLDYDLKNVPLTNFTDELNLTSHHIPCKLLFTQPSASPTAGMHKLVARTESHCSPADYTDKYLFSIFICFFPDGANFTDEFNYTKLWDTLSHLLMASERTYATKTLGTLTLKVACST